MQYESKGPAWGMATIRSYEEAKNYCLTMIPEASYSDQNKMIYFSTQEAETKFAIWRKSKFI